MTSFIWRWQKVMQISPERLLLVYILPFKGTVPLRNALFPGTLPESYALFTGIVPVRYALFKGTVPVRYALFTGTVLVNNIFLENMLHQLGLIHIYSYSFFIRIYSCSYYFSTK